MTVADTYRVFGLRLVSEIPLPDLHRDEDPGRAGDVFIRIGQVPKWRDDEPTGLSMADDGAVLNIEGVGRYWIRSGSEIIVAPSAGASERNVRLFLLGSAIAGILHQRGLLPLHANAVEIAGKAVAFMGHSGAGKSTMAAWFHDRGLRVLADDVCVVRFEGGKALAHAGIPRLPLWKEALEVSGRNPEAYEESFDDTEKYNVPTDFQPEADPIELSHIYLLGQSASGTGRLERLEGVRAVEALVANTYRGGYLPLMGQTQRHMMQCLEFARQVPVFSAERVWGFEAFEEQALLLEDHARSVAEAPVS